MYTLFLNERYPHGTFAAGGALVLIQEKKNIKNASVMSVGLRMPATSRRKIFVTIVKNGTCEKCSILNCYSGPRSGLSCLIIVIVVSSDN